MSVSAGLAVANTYYSQPILKEIADTVAVPVNKVGYIPALSIAGYGVGLFIITPLGDSSNRKKLLLRVQLLLVMLLLTMATAQTYWQIGMLSFLIGCFSITAQLLIPMAAVLDKASRAKTVSIIVTGLLIGMLSARIFSGYISTVFNWRCVYGFSAVLVLCSTLLLHLLLPNSAKSYTGNYIELLRSTAGLAARLPLLRIHALLGALIFATLCAFWTTLTLHLSGTPWHYSPATIGSFSITGVAGALATLVIGKYITAYNSTRARIAAVGCIITGIVLPVVFPYAITALIVSIVLLDVGVQATQLTNLATIYTLYEQAPSRVNTVYMTISFAGGALGTIIALYCWKYGGWLLVLGLLSALSITAIFVAWHLHVRAHRVTTVAAV